jgi:small-conductance mechanosensitive channel
MQSITNWFKSLDDFVIFKLGTNVFTLGTLFYLFLSLSALFYVTGLIKKILVNRVFVKFHMEAGVSQAIATLIRYILVLIGSIIIVQSTGINLSTIGLLIGGLGIGIGFGLQNISNNLISGIIILFERPIKVGDRIEIGSTHGKVLKVSPRATTILTNDNISIIVPNAEFMSSRVINWSHNDDKIRFHVSVLVPFSSDFDFVTKILLEIASENPDVLEEPAPDVRLESFEENGIKCTLLVWSSSLMHRQGKLKSNINKAINRKFNENGIYIPYPQRVFTIKGEGLKEQT